jgi:hypothetical protein
MTDLQDAILDKLVGSSVGVDWPDGPLAIAAEVVGGSKPVKFGQTDNDRGAKAVVAARLGYPVLLCEAIQGANRGLKAEDDRRSLAMSLFATISVGGALPRLSSLAQNKIAACLAIRVHPYVCPRTDCPVPAALARLVEAPEVTRALCVSAERARCETAGRISAGIAAWAGLTARSTREERLAQTAARALFGLRVGRSPHGWSSLRESARLAASERGLAEAVACCVEVARQCGLAV